MGLAARPGRGVPAVHTFAPGGQLASGPWLACAVPFGGSGCKRRGLPDLIGVYHHFQRGGEPLASDHDTTTAVGCHAVARRECTRRRRWPVAVWVRPSWRRSRCGACGRRAPRYDRRPRRRWLHVPWGRTPVWLQYAPWRVSCRQCGVRVERVSWAVGNSAFTAPLEELTAYLAQVTDRTTVSRVLGISWPAVG